MRTETFRAKSLGRKQRTKGACAHHKLFDKTKMVRIHHPASFYRLTSGLPVLTPFCEVTKESSNSMSWKN
jgi:hypothetical protein